LTNYLLDTNVISEWVKPRPSPNVIRWLASANEDSVFLSVLTFAEIREGIAAMSAGRRRDALFAWQTDLYYRFERRILPIDYPIAEAWGDLIARARKSGAPLNPMDAFLAATAQVHSLVLVTRNTRHFAHTGLSLLNPWQ
jgi:hypothetical protein